MKAKLINNEWVFFSQLPTFWENKMPYNAIEEGFKDVVYPIVNEDQKRGSFYYDDVNDLCTYYVIDKTIEELAAEELEASKVVPNLNFKMQLAADGIYEADILQIIHTLPEPTRTQAQISYKEANTFDLSNPFVGMVGQAFGKTQAEMNQIFINAKKMQL